MRDPRVGPPGCAPLAPDGRVRPRPSADGSSCRDTRCARRHCGQTPPAWGDASITHQVISSRIPTRRSTRASEWGRFWRPLQIFFKIGGAESRRRIADSLEDVRLDASYAQCYPDQLSGGERQRVAIARALMARPELLVCDEVLSALDVSAQAGLIELLTDLKRRTRIGRPSRSYAASSSPSSPSPSRTCRRPPGASFMRGSSPSKRTRRSGRSCSASLCAGSCRSTTTARRSAGHRTPRRPPSPR